MLIGIEMSLPAASEFSDSMRGYKYRGKRLRVAAGFFMEKLHAVAQSSLLVLCVVSHALFWNPCPSILGVEVVF